MKAREFLSEKVGKMTDYQSKPMKGAEMVRDPGGYDRIYHMNRLMMAMAIADGKDHKPVDMDDSSWTEKYNTIHPYSEAEHNMVTQAMGTVPTDHVSGFKNHRSEEPKGTNKVSPVTGFKGYPR
jgi:hypothetical protein